MKNEKETFCGRLNVTIVAIPKYDKKCDGCIFENDTVEDCFADANNISCVGPCRGDWTDVIWKEKVL